MAKNISCIQWAELWYYRLNNIEASTVLKHETCISKEAIKRSPIPYSESWFGGIESRTFDAREVVGYDHGTLAYDHLGSQHKEGTVYGDGTTSI